jgi:hypothetical protein
MFSANSKAALKVCLLSGSRSRRSHRSSVVRVVMMNVVMMMMMVMVMVVMMRRLGHRSGSGCRSVLRHGVAGEAERQNRRGGKGLDHGRSFLWLGNPNGSQRSIEVAA